MYFWVGEKGRETIQKEKNKNKRLAQVLGKFESNIYTHVNMYVREIKNDLRTHLPPGVGRGPR